MEVQIEPNDSIWIKSKGKNPQTVNVYTDWDGYIHTSVPEDVNTDK